MADFPALMLWTDKYLADTRHLTTLEHGAYLLLIMEAWRRPHCDLPDDDLILARMAGLSAEEWAATKPVIMAFWTLDKRSKKWRQKKLTSERDYVTKKRKSQQDKAAKRWQKTENPDATAHPRQSRGNAPTPTPTHLSVETIVSTSARPQKSPARKPESPSFWNNVPDWVPLDRWQAFLRMRRDKRRPVTDEAARLLLLKLEALRDAGSDPGAVLDRSTEASWTGLFPLDPPKEPHNGHAHPSRAQDGAVAELERRIAARRSGAPPGEVERPGAGGGGGTGQLALARPAAGGSR